MRALETKKPVNGAALESTPNTGLDTHEKDRVMTENMTPTGGNGKPPATVTRRFNDVAIGQRLDGYLNATAMCKAAGCEWKAYNRLGGTAAFLEELAGSVKISTDLLVQSVTAGPNAGRGTWVHPQVGYHLAQWCSPAFAVQVTEWIHEIKTHGYATAPGVDLDLDLLRRIGGISRMLSGKVTGTEKMVKLIADAVERADQRVEHLEVAVIALAEVTRDLKKCRTTEGT